MDISVNFSHTDAPEYVRDHLAEWISQQLSDLEPEHNLQVKLYCSKECATAHGDGSQFKCRVLASAPWISSPIVVRTTGDKCWETIVDCCHILRQQVAKSRKKLRNHRHELQTELVAETFDDRMNVGLYN